MFARNQRKWKFREMSSRNEPLVFISSRPISLYPDISRSDEPVIPFDHVRDRNFQFYFRVAAEYHPRDNQRARRDFIIRRKDSFVRPCGRYGKVKEWERI